jgi:hypothetical protein
MAYAMRWLSTVPLVRGSGTPGELSVDGAGHLLMIRIVATSPTHEGIVAL